MKTIDSHSEKRIKGPTTISCGLDGVRLFTGAKPGLRRPLHRG
jgi:hypothetical protein